MVVPGGSCCSRRRFVMAPSRLAGATGALPAITWFTALRDSNLTKTLRPANIPFPEERERMRQNPGEIFGKSGDAYMFIASRSLRQWERCRTIAKRPRHVRGTTSLAGQDG